MAKILLAEDDERISRVLSLRLTLKGHAIECVDNGATVVEKASGRLYDLILMDMHMPVMEEMDPGSWTGMRKV